MAKILNLVIQERSDPHNPAEFVVSFGICQDVRQPEQALRAAVSEFIHSGTDEAADALTCAKGYFNWSHAVTRVPDSMFIRHGLTPLRQDAADVFVEYNETLNYDNADDPCLAGIRKMIKERISYERVGLRYWASGENLVAEGIMDEIYERIDTLNGLLSLDAFDEDALSEWIENGANGETDDQLIGLYECILEELQTY